MQKLNQTELQLRKRIMLKWSILALTVVCGVETAAGGYLVIKYAANRAFGAMAIQFAGFLISLVGAAYGVWWLLKHWREIHVK